MAIKGKNKRRAKQRSAPRPPRHEPVAPPTPLHRRPWIALTAGVLLGVTAMVLLVTVTNAMRASDESAEATSAASTRRVAALAYQGAVRDAFSGLGVVDPGRPPTIFVEMNAALDALAKGKPPDDAEQTFRAAAADAAEAQDALEAFDVSATIRDQGFDPVGSASFTGSAITLGSALDLYRQAARVAISAVAASGPERDRLADVAADLRDSASGNLIAGWSRYLQALEAGGIPEAPTVGTVPDLGGG